MAIGFAPINVSPLLSAMVDPRVPKPRLIARSNHIRVQDLYTYNARFIDIASLRPAEWDAIFGLLCLGDH